MKFLSMAVFPTDEEIRKLAIGDSIASAGLLPGFSGEKRNYPFFKFGHISAISDESIRTTCPLPIQLSPVQQLEPRLEKAWFIGINLVGGNSGSPVFYYPTTPADMPRVFLIGIQSSSIAVADVATMAPISYVFDILKSIGLADANLQRGTPQNK